VLPKLPDRAATATSLAEEGTATAVAADGKVAGDGREGASYSGTTVRRILRASPSRPQTHACSSASSTKENAGRSKGVRGLATLTRGTAVGSIRSPAWNNSSNSFSPGRRPVNSIATSFPG
jgi:hypothetical protein